ncbi:hypothetical protein [Cribrihabitans neustonicus]|uniref:hypothetical protein n=1 Tax=Cribrihabitans neustonicus TaxID=1429085 RepID=UPI003B5967E4
MTVRLAANWLNWIRLALAAGFLALFAPPQEAHAHSGHSADQSMKAVHQNSGASVGHAEDTLLGHCHAGLDCSVFAIFSAPAAQPAPHLQTKPLRRRQHRSVCGWDPGFDPPPPRVLV